MARYDEVVAEIRARFAIRIEACERLRDWVQDLFDDWPGRGILTGPDVLIGAIFTRSFDTYTSVIQLAAGGYGTQGAMLNRSLFEDMVDAHWIAHDPRAAVERYEAHHKHGQMLRADAIRKYPEMFPNAELPSFDADDRKRLDRVFGEYGHKPWSTVSLHKRVDLIQDQWKD